MGEDIDFRSGLADNLRDDGHDVLEYSSPNLLPSLAALGSFAVVITEDVMGGETAQRFCTRLRATHPTVPVVVLTAYSQRLEKDESATQIVRILEKPIDYGPLHQLIHRLREAIFYLTARRNEFSLRRYGQWLQIFSK